MIDLVHVVRLFAEDCKKPKVAHFRPLAAVLDVPAIQKLHAARHEFRWSNEAELLARKNEGWWLVLAHDTNGQPTIFTDREEELVLLHRRSQGVKPFLLSHVALKSPGALRDNPH